MNTLLKAFFMAVFLFGFGFVRAETPTTPTPCVDGTSVPSARYVDLYDFDNLFDQWPHVEIRKTTDQNVVAPFLSGGNRANRLLWSSTPTSYVTNAHPVMLNRARQYSVQPAYQATDSPVLYVSWYSWRTQTGGDKASYSPESEVTSGLIQGNFTDWENARFIAPLDVAVGASGTVKYRTDSDVYAWRTWPERSKDGTVVYCYLWDEAGETELFSCQVDIPGTGNGSFQLASASPEKIPENAVATCNVRNYLTLPDGRKVADLAKKAEVTRDAIRFTGINQ